MAGHASGWHKIAKGPLKGQSLFVSKKVAKTMGLGQDEIGRILGGEPGSMAAGNIINRARGTQPAGVAKAKMDAAQVDKLVASVLSDLGSEYKVSVRYPSTDAGDGDFWVSVSSNGEIDAIRVPSTGALAIEKAVSKWHYDKADSLARDAELLAAAEKAKKARAVITRNYSASRKKIVARYPALAALGDKLRVLDYATDPQVRLHISDLAMVSPDLLSAVAKAGGKVYLGKPTLPNLDDLAYLKEKSPSSGLDGGWPPGSTFDEVGGVYSHNERAAIVSTNPTIQHGSVSVAVHEFGHAVGDLLGWNNDPMLASMHASIYSRLSPYLRQGGPGADVGTRELLAEGMADIIVDERQAVIKYGAEFVDYMKSGPMSGSSF